MASEAIVEAVTREVLTALVAGDRTTTAAVRRRLRRQRRQGGGGRGHPDQLQRQPGADVPTDLAGFIDHTLLRAGCHRRRTSTGCATRRSEYGFASVCVNPAWVQAGSPTPAGTDV